MDWMMAAEKDQLRQAMEDFQQARNRAALQGVLARLRGRSEALLDYEEVRRMLKTEGSSERGLQDIPLDAIVGSVGRYTDFNRDFLPLRGEDMDRWAHVKAATLSETGLPPIEVYQIDQAYFVKDGNHRVSVARDLGATHIHAYVTEIKSRVPFTPETRPGDLIIKAEYAAFLEKTRLDSIFPDLDLAVSVPGQYETLLEHIQVHRYYMGLDLKRDIAYEEAAGHWYETVYLPAAVLICEAGILDAFPGRTETDLYLWISEHQAAIQEQLGWEVTPRAAAADLLEKQRGSRLSSLAQEPQPGQWRRERATDTQRAGRLFRDILIPLNGQDSGWEALHQAAILGQSEAARLHGLHILPEGIDAGSESVKAVRSEFNHRLVSYGMTGELTIESGEISTLILSYARWVDIVVARLAHPPEEQMLARLSSGLVRIIQRCPRPILTVPQQASQIRRALLAYDGSPKAKEALYLAAYLAGSRQTQIAAVASLSNTNVIPETLTEAIHYLDERSIPAESIRTAAAPAEAILRVAGSWNADLILMGGYGARPMIELFVGSTVDAVLREATCPVLISR
jgi:nucleotide-binding universal stress UspA family protein